MNRQLAAAAAAIALAVTSDAGAVEVYNQPLTTPRDDAKAEAATPAAQSLNQLYRLAAAVPEPMTWAMMIIGFGAAGQILRRRRAIGDL